MEQKEFFDCILNNLMKSIRCDSGEQVFHSFFLSYVELRLPA